MLGGAPSPMDVHAEVRAAARRIAAHVRRTPVEPSAWLSEAAGCLAHLKLENFQRTGSFKLRGAMNKLLALDPERRARGVVAASTGNHGAALGLGGATLGCPVTIFAPETARTPKLDAVRALGARVRLAGVDCLEAEAAAREHAREHDLVYVSPYNDADVVAGQGTVGLELDQDLERLDAVVVSVGGGGLIAGIGGYLATARPGVEVVGCSPERSAVLHASLEAGRILDLPSRPTLSDGTAGGVEPGSITFELCRRFVDRFVLVSEEEIADGMRAIVSRHHMLVEGAAGAAVAAFLRERERFAGKEVAIVLCGANVDGETLKRIL